jgi:hypothetical protein
VIIQLQRLPNTIRGIYGPGKDMMPSRGLFIHPVAAPSFYQLGGNRGQLAFSDIFRSADASLAAVIEGRGAQPPAYSAHNYGLAFDLAVDDTLGILRCTYTALLQRLAADGWHCYRRDGRRGKEDWHFNYLGDQSAAVLATLTQDHSTWPRAAEAAIQRWYGGQFSLTVERSQQLLTKLKLYGGGADGRVGPLTKQAAGAFARAWHLDSGDVYDERFQRTLTYVSAEQQIDYPPTQ